MTLQDFKKHWPFRMIIKGVVAEEKQLHFLAFQSLSIHAANLLSL